MPYRFLLAAFTLSLLAAPLASPVSLADPIRTTNGLVAGTTGSDGSVRIYKGIPFAAPPVGDLRWRAPEPPADWEGVRPGDQFGASCVQQLTRSREPWTEEFMVQNEVSEDCLFLNIWTGARRANEKRPVMVYIHGSAFVEGSGEISVYDGEAFAKKGIVVVTINYRMGLFGFFTHPELSGETEARASGNYGLMDAAAALAWVRDNIAAFGGDSAQVTVAGQSAGASAVHYLTASPMAAGLFQRAIAQSGSRVGTTSGSLAEGEALGIRFAESKGVRSLARLRALTAEELMKVDEGAPPIRFRPVVDGHFIQEDIPGAFARGRQNDVPTLTGLNADEGSSSPTYGRIPAAEWRTQLRNRYGGDADAFMALYPFSDDAEAGAMQLASSRDQGVMAMYLWAEQRAKTAKTPAYLYYFDRAMPWPEFPRFGAYHTGEMPYVFNNLDRVKRPWEAVDRQVADQVSSYWVNFVKTGAPNGRGLPAWVPFGASDAPFQRLATTSGPMALPDAEKRSFHTKILMPHADDWAVYLGDKGRTHYSPLDQITPENVASLKVAWSYDTGEQSEFQANPIVIDGVLYTATPGRQVLALDAATGLERWRFNPTSVHPGPLGSRQRGVVYYNDGVNGRIFSSAGGHLYALDARTGQLVSDFGVNGSIPFTQNTPGVIYGDLLIVSPTVGERSPGSVQAYDARTGEKVWHFNLIPRPGEYGYRSWPAEAHKVIGGGSDWSGSALDEARGILYASTETAGPDFYGGERHGMNLFANSVVALDARTGKRLWHFQVVHHDVLDKDLPSPPTLLTVTHDGRRIDALAQGTKHGLLFVFDRVTGEPLWPIEERPVPQSTLPGEQLWPTQPFPTWPAPLMRQQYTADDISNISPEATALTAERLALSGSFGPFAAPELKESIFFPGYDGGFEWGGSAADLDGIFYTNVNEIPWFLQMIETKRPDGSPVPPGEMTYMANCASCHGFDRTGDPASGFPSLLDLEGRKTRDEVTAVLTSGLGRMPAFTLRENQQKLLLDFLYGVEVPPPPPPPADQSIDPHQQLDDAVPYTFAGFKRWFDAEGYPAIKPPWGTLNAVDLNTGELLWKVPLGEYPELTARGIPPTGTENYGGPVVTASGLLFIGATADGMFRAFDKKTGEILWQTKLPFSGTATPSTYRVHGKQYVVIAAAGGKSKAPGGTGRIVAFALPE
ncbi:MAG: carboxylesterase family protein [Rhodothermales bacterium]|nr:carboxylesterase family protein [Rhodothermales bacterium]